ncbi:MAG: HAMP domain-containing protein, partial [Thalassolituus sp.]
MRRYEFRTLQERLLAYMVALVLLPVLLLVGIGLNYAEHQIERQVMRDLSVTMSSQMQKLHLAVTTPVEDLRIISRSPYVQEALTDFSAVYDPANLYSMDYQNEQDKYWIYLSFYAEKHGLSDLLLINTSGDVVFSAAQSDLYGRNLDHVDFTGSGLQRAFRQSLWQMDSSLAVSRNRSEGYVYVAAPVVVGSALRGVIMLIPGTGLLKQLVDASSGGEQNALTIYRQGAERYQALLSEAKVEKHSTEGRLIASAMLGRDYEGVLAGEDKDWLVSVRALPVLDSVVIMRRDREAVLSAVSELRYSGWGVTLVILLITVMISRRVAKNLSAPVYELTSSIEKVARGERDVRVSDERKDELGVLAKHF